MRSRLLQFLHFDLATTAVFDFHLILFKSLWGDDDSCGDTDEVGIREASADGEVQAVIEDAVFFFARARAFLKGSSSLDFAIRTM